MDKSNLDSLRVEITYSLVIPCYNESENLVNLINRCKYLITEEENIEVVIVDNGSTDSTPKVLNDLLKNLGVQDCLVRFNSLDEGTNYLETIYNPNLQRKYSCIAIEFI